MIDAAWLWVPATLVASTAQVARNAMQRRLTEVIGTVGATQVRFLYGLPFALLFLVLVRLGTGEAVPRPGPGFAGFLLLGAVSQITATALMLAAMRRRSFSVVTALTKTEAVQIALFGFAFLGDPLSPLSLAAIVVATAGVVVISWNPGAAREARDAGFGTIGLGIGAGALFALSAVGFRGAILALAEGSFLIRATTTLCWSLATQSALLLGWLGAFDRPALGGSLRHWRASLGAGFVGAFASQCWFIGFALTAAANVRTLSLVEILLAQAVSRRLLAQATPSRELAGIALIAAGVGVLLWSAR